ncbi:GNAT family N-acetyltransferase [Beijerinckia sp. L45]|uniref:GNAT family N-acetyltransferase n=1 Tax=Beijerinckia sp. L45 TaxID=1641855 RepID=UPI00131D24A3|nr:GNAT family N-acetyltransferase [Beijerinckia sp. L45]
MTQNHTARLVIRDADASDERQWRRLWGLYNLFYDHAVSEPVTAATWQRILDPQSAIFARIAVDGTALVGLATYVLHDCTWTIAPVCYLEDLFVDAAQRKTGTGRALIEDGVAIAKARQLGRVYWHTKADNVVARRLYDTFVQVDDFVRYTLPMD